MKRLLSMFVTSLSVWAIVPLAAQYPNFRLGGLGQTPQNWGGGTYNTTFGLSTLMNNYGSYNVALGNGALAYNTSGNNNTAAGINALMSNTTGSQNTAVGFNSLISNTTGFGLTAIGDNALAANTIGKYNTALGILALNSNTTGDYNTGLGTASLQYNTIGGLNVGIGAHALRNNTTGSWNTSIGVNSLPANLTGTFNTATGYNALYKNVIGVSNTGMGAGALEENTAGNYNVAVGIHAARLNTTGHNNTALGTGALYNNLYGIGNTAVGCNANTVSADLSNATAIGYAATVNASNKVVIGNQSVRVIGGSVGWSVLSDKRYKKNIAPTQHNLAFILDLKPVSYQYDQVKIFQEEQDAVNTLSKRSQDTGSTMAAPVPTETYQKGLQAAEKSSEKLFYGLLAQDVDASSTKTGYKNFSGVVSPDENGGKYALRYSEFVVPLIGAVQEQQAQFAALSKENEALKARLERLEQTIQKGSNAATTQKVGVTTAQLEQNLPNPVKSVAKIPYFVPENSANAQIVIYNAVGSAVKTVAIERLGEGILEVQLTGLPAGTYPYTLIVDGQLVSSKKMTVSN